MTRHLSTGHIRTLLFICFPLMLSALSGTLMHFIDRIILAKYDTNAMIAVTTASNILFIFQFGALSIAMIAEVFVGRSHGAGQYKDVSKPVWQMIWFSIFCAFILIPLGLFGHSLFLPPELVYHGASYFKWMMIFSFSYPLAGALSAFFVGKGQVKPVVLAVISANLINLLLVIPFVFGIEGFIPEMGAKGAALATGIAELSSALLLFFLFLHRTNREKYHTHKWYFNKNIFMKCFQIGFPNTLGHMGSYAAWAMIMYLMAVRSTEHVTVMSIGLILWMLFSFITEGLQKGVTAIASNCIGANQWHMIPKVLKSGIKLQFILALILAIPLVIFPNLFVDLFIPVDVDQNELAHLKNIVIICCRWLWLAYWFDGMTWIIDGILTAAGDSRFIMLMNSFGTWIFCVAPIYYFIVYQEGSSILTLQLITAFCFILFLSYFLRYRSKSWMKMQKSTQTSKIAAEPSEKLAEVR